MGEVKSMIMRWLSLITCCLSLLMAGCRDHQESHHEDKGHQSIMQSLPDQLQDTVIYDEEVQALMEDLKKALVHLPQNQELQNPQPPSADQTFVLLRKPDLSAFPCSTCHGEVPQKLANEVQDAHWNIQVNHANAQVMNCTSCHDLEKPDALVSLTGAAIDFDHSYQVCAQCHSSQAKDWLGGAHGKRVKGWIEPRTIHNCVSCHNPHQPQIESRWPARLNTVKLIERNP